MFGRHLIIFFFYFQYNIFLSNRIFFISDVYNAATRKCRKMFDNLYNDCMDELPIIVDMLCNVVRLHGLCDLIKGKLLSKHSVRGMCHILLLSLIIYLYPQQMYFDDNTFHMYYCCLNYA